MTLPDASWAVAQTGHELHSCRINEVEDALATICAPSVIALALSTYPGDWPPCGRVMSNLTIVSVLIGA
jgi:hypothetical protein